MHAIERFGLISLLLLTGSVTAFALWEPAPDPAADRVARADARERANEAERKPEPDRPGAPVGRTRQDSPGLQGLRVQPTSKVSEPTAKPENETASRWVERHTEPTAPTGPSLFGRAGDRALTGPGLQADEPQAGRSQRKVRDPEADAVAAREAEARRTLAGASEAQREAFEPGLTTKGSKGEPKAAAGGTRPYVVAKGDVLGLIAQRELGKSSHQSLILALNPGLDADHIFVGQEILLPLQVGEAPSAEPVVATAVTPGAAEARPAATDGSKHRVAEGESLWNIARKRLGDPTRWKEIAALNPHVDANNLEPGQVLDLPSGTPGIEVAQQRSDPATRVSKVR